MRRWVVGVLTAVVLVVAAWIGWPREDTATDDAAGTVQDGVTQGEDGDDGGVAAPATSTPAPPSDVVEDGDVDPGEPAREVVEEPEFDADEKPAQQVEATWDDDVRLAAREAAVAAVAAFAAVDKSAEAWWDDLSPLLTPQARAVYEDVDPRNVPVRDVTGAAKITDESSTLLTEVQVPTDAGDYTVLLVRADGGSPWLAEQIRPSS
ncbi:hypothetical protein [Myceligenerans crystallogenes]|uniref:Mce-associated membrane protein n=1 Tax=Myceligenerans crystallogenes TaxID=316335 RepID=A0ABP4ZM56_9MICO